MATSPEKPPAVDSLPRAGVQLRRSDRRFLRYFAEGLYVEVPSGYNMLYILTVCGLRSVYR